MPDFWRSIFTRARQIQIDLKGRAAGLTEIKPNRTVRNVWALPFTAPVGRRWGTMSENAPVPRMLPYSPTANFKAIYLSE